MTSQLPVGYTVIAVNYKYIFSSSNYIDFFSYLMLSVILKQLLKMLALQLHTWRKN